MSDIGEQWPQVPVRTVPFIHRERQHALHRWMAERWSRGDITPDELAAMFDATYSDGWIDGQRHAAALTGAA